MQIILISFVSLRLSCSSFYAIVADIQSNDNSFYLSHNYYNQYDTGGAPFFDYRNTDLLNNQQINIYGHNSKTYDIPFRKLENFLDKEFFDNNQYILLQDDNGRKIYQIFAIKEVSSDYSHMKVNLTGAEFVSHVKNLGSSVIYSRDLVFDENSKILVLQTCSYTSSESYYVITAILVE